MCIFSCLVFKVTVAYENLQPSTVAYKRVAYKKKECNALHDRYWCIEDMHQDIMRGWGEATVWVACFNRVRSVNNLLHNRLIVYII